MSQQLYDCGKSAPLLLLFDTYVPGSSQRVAVGDQISQHWQNCRRYGVKYLLDRSEAKGRHYWSTLVHCLKAGTCGCYRLGGRSLPPGLRDFQLEESHKRVLQRYRVRTYPGIVTLLRAVDYNPTVGTRRAPLLGWEKFAVGGFEIHDVPGEHESMFKEPNVRILAETLKTILPA